MAASVFERKLFDDIFVCSICLQNLCKPKVLPCLHSFCQNCVERHYKTDRHRNAISSSGNFFNPSFTCPACRVQIIIPNGKVRDFYEDTSIQKIENFLKEVFLPSMDLDKDDNFNPNSENEFEGCLAEPNENDSLLEAGNIREKMRKEIQDVQGNLVLFRYKLMKLMVMKDNVANEKNRQVLVINESEPVNHLKLTKELNVSFRPVEAQLATFECKLFTVSCAQKAVYSIVEELIEKGDDDQLIVVHEYIFDMINESKDRPNVNLEDLYKCVASININTSLINSKGYIPKIPKELFLNPIRNKAIDESKRLLFKLTTCGAGRGELNFPTHATYLPNGSFVVSDKRNHRLQFFDRFGRFEKVLKVFGLKPIRARLNRKNDLLYVSDETTACVKIFTKDGEYVRSLGQKFFVCPAGLDFTSEGHVIISDAEKATVSIHSQNDKMIKKFCYAYFQQRVPCPYFVTCSKDDYIVVSDYRNNTVRGFTNFGRELFCISDLVCPRGVCTDKSGNILIAEADAHKITLYSPFGKYLQTVLTEKDGLRYPMSIDIDEEFRILVTQCGLFGNHVVMMFQLSYQTKI